MCIKIVVATIAALVSLFTFEVAVHRGLAVYDGRLGLSPFYTPPLRPRPPQASPSFGTDNFLVFPPSTNTFNTSVSLQEKPQIDQDEAVEEETYQPTHQPVSSAWNWKHTVIQLAYNLAILEIRFYSILKHLCQTFVLGQTRTSYPPKRRNKLQVTVNTLSSEIAELRASHSAEVQSLNVEFDNRHKEAVSNLLFQVMGNTAIVKKAHEGRMDSLKQKHSQELLALTSKHLDQEQAHLTVLDTIKLKRELEIREAAAKLDEEVRKSTSLNLSLEWTKEELGRAREQTENLYENLAATNRATNRNESKSSALIESLEFDIINLKEQRDDIVKQHEAEVEDLKIKLVEAQKVGEASRTEVRECQKQVSP